MQYLKRAARGQPEYKPASHLRGWRICLKTGLPVKYSTVRAYTNQAAFSITLQSRRCNASGTAGKIVECIEGARLVIEGENRSADPAFRTALGIADLRSTVSDAAFENRLRRSLRRKWRAGEIVVDVDRVESRRRNGVRIEGHERATAAIHSDAPA